MKKIVVAVTLLGAIIFIPSCKTSKSTTDAPKVDKDAPYEPAQANVAVHQYAMEDLRKGREIFIANCQKCHRLYPANRHDADGWQMTLQRMQPKAGISNEQRDLVLKYLSSYAN
ncbi:MAG: hypothetical protein U0T84_11760 [Chitinophagales bacterium]